MSEKQRLITANTRFDQTLLKMINELEEQKSPEGQYVWKKYGKVIVAGDVIATCIGAGSAISWQLSATNGSLKSLTKKDLVGLKLTNSTNVSQYLNIDSETSSTWRFSASYTYTQEWTYDDATKTITVPTNVGGSVGDKYNVSGVTFNVESLTFVDFVVSDDETAYPDGGEQDGYWYERVEGFSADEVLTPEMFGCTKMAVDTMVYSGTFSVSDLTVSHSLGEIPKMIIIRPKTALKFTQTNELSFVFGRASAGSTSKNLYVHMWYQTKTSAGTESLLTGGAAYSISNVTTTNFRLPKTSTFNSYYWSPGVEYEVIAFA